MRVLKVFGCLFLGIMALRLSAQTADKVNLIVRINPEMGYQHFRASLPSLFTDIRCADQDFGLYTMSIPAGADVHAALALLQHSKGCITAQIAHKVTPRYNPNDPLISNQVHLGIIKAYTAWDYGRGRGVTGFGDTIVIALIDDGLDTLQPDLAESVWKNRNEIPWNGIDDDGNGYLDDYYGWNGGDSNCRVVTSQTIGQGHGTSVAGVLGATSENGIGITGTAYKTKIMPLLCYSTTFVDGEIGVVRCMLYAWRQKKLYLSSNGKKGANIVAANFSVGIDRAFPSDAPLWCALYDSLGKAGILSCGATTDADNNIDAVGDIPTTCPSPYLITVSFTNNSDERMPSGYSPTKIDLAAPGQDIYTTIQRRDAGANQPYAKKSGTSFSTPMVTGTLGYIYNNVCDSFLRFQKNNNDSAQKLLKSWILNGTDKLPGLSGKCLTGGRLNMLSVWQNMDAWCKANDQKYAVEPLELRDLKFFPNPMQAGEDLFLADPTGQKWILQVTDIAGRTLYKSAGINNNNLARFEIPPLPAGIYMIHCSSAAGQLVRKLQVY